MKVGIEMALPMPEFKVTKANESVYFDREKPYQLYKDIEERFPVHPPWPVHGPALKVDLRRPDDADIAKITPLAYEYHKDQKLYALLRDFEFRHLRRKELVRQEIERHVERMLQAEAVTRAFMATERFNRQVTQTKRFEKVARDGQKQVERRRSDRKEMIEDNRLLSYIRLYLKEFSTTEQLIRQIREDRLYEPTLFQMMLVKRLMFLERKETRSHVEKMRMKRLRSLLAKEIINLKEGVQQARDFEAEIDYEIKDVAHAQTVEKIDQGRLKELLSEELDVRDLEKSKLKEKFYETLDYRKKEFVRHYETQLAVKKKEHFDRMQAVDAKFAADQKNKVQNFSIRNHTKEIKMDPGYFSTQYSLLVYWAQGLVKVKEASKQFNVDVIAAREAETADHKKYAKEKIYEKVGGELEPEPRLAPMPKGPAIQAYQQNEYMTQPEINKTEVKVNDETLYEDAIHMERMLETIRHRNFVNSRILEEWQKAAPAQPQTVNLLMGFHTHAEMAADQVEHEEPHVEEVSRTISVKVAA